jgi:hypothetical protein
MPKKGSRRVTRRAGKSPAMSVEALQGSFSVIDTKVARAIEGRASDAELVGVIQAAWNAQFHRPLSAAASRGLIEHYRAVHTEGGAKKRRTRRRQRGGMAPLDWTLGQGTTLPVYGSFPVEVGMSAQAVRTLDMNRFFESSVSRACDSTGGAPAPAQKGGSKSRAQHGGGLFDALVMGHAPASVPHNVIEMGVSAVQGAPIGNPSSDPIRGAIPLASQPLRPFDTTGLSGATMPVTPLWTGSF